MVRVVEYLTWRHRNALCAIALENGETMEHDDVLPDGTKRLTFLTVPHIKPSPARIVQQALEQKLASRTIVYSELLDLLAYQRGL